MTAGILLTCLVMGKLLTSRLLVLLVVFKKKNHVDERIYIFLWLKIFFT